MVWSGSYILPLPHTTVICRHLRYCCKQRLINPDKPNKGNSLSLIGIRTDFKVVPTIDRPTDRPGLQRGSGRCATAHGTEEGCCCRRRRRRRWRQQEKVPLRQVKTIARGRDECVQGQMRTQQHRGRYVSWSLWLTIVTFHRQ